MQLSQLLMNLRHKQQTLMLDGHVMALPIRPSPCSFMQKQFGVVWSPLQSATSVPHLHRLVFSPTFVWSRDHSDALSLCPVLNFTAKHPDAWRTRPPPSWLNPHWPSFIFIYLFFSLVKLFRTVPQCSPGSRLLLKIKSNVICNVAQGGWMQRFPALILLCLCLFLSAVCRLWDLHQSQPSIHIATP